MADGRRSDSGIPNPTAMASVSKMVAMISDIDCATSDGGLALPKRMICRLATTALNA